MSGIFSLIVILVPIILILGLTYFFIRLFKNTSAEDHIYVKDLASLETMKRKAQQCEATIVSAHAELPSRFSPATRILNLKFQIKDNRENKIYSARWRVDTNVLLSLQPGSIAQVKVYNELVFPTTEGADLYL